MGPRRPGEAAAAHAAVPLTPPPPADKRSCRRNRGIIPPAYSYQASLPRVDEPRNPLGLVDLDEAAAVALSQALAGPAVAVELDGHRGPGLR